MGNLASVDWNWAGFQGPTGESLEERIDGLLAIGVRSLVLRDFGLDEYLAHQEKAGARMPLAATVLYLKDVLRGAETEDHAGARLRGLLNAVGRFGGDGVIVVNGDPELPGRHARSHDALVRVIEAASPGDGDPAILFEPMAGRLNDFFRTPDDALDFARERLPGVPVKLVFDTYHIAAAGNDVLEEFDRLRDHVGHVHLSDFIAGREPDDDRAFPGGGELPFRALLEEMGPGSGIALALEDALWRLPPRDSMIFLSHCVPDQDGGVR